jgi:hypothetical protein
VNFESDIHAFLAGGITAVLDFRNMEHALGRKIKVIPQVDGKGNYLPEWRIHVAGGEEKLAFRLRLEQLAKGDWPAT